MTSGLERMTADVHGRVQGVGFRWFVRREARALGLSGWVRNEPGGSVRLEAEGPRDLLRELEAAIRRGPSGSRVDRVDVRTMRPSGDTGPFEIR